MEKEFKELPYGVTAAVREDEDNKYVFLHNFAMEEKCVKNVKEFEDMESGEGFCSDIVIPARSAKILKISK